jgi:hypothetical protein
VANQKARFDDRAFLMVINVGEVPQVLSALSSRERKNAFRFQSKKQMNESIQASYSSKFHTYLLTGMQLHWQSGVAALFHPEIILIATFS